MKELLPIRHILLYSTLITKAKNFKVGILSSLFHKNSIVEWYLNDCVYILKKEV